MSNLPNIPIPEPILQRFWDYLVQRVADAATRRDRDDIAKRIERLRIQPNLKRLMNESVLEGWHSWLKRSRWPQVTEAVQIEYQTHFPTLLREQAAEAVRSPLRRDDVEGYLARWFHDLECGLPLDICREVARELIGFALKAAAGKSELTALIQNVLRWDGAHPRPRCHLSERVGTIRDLARQRAEEDRYALVTSAHLLWALASLQPQHAPQQILAAVHATPDDILAAIRKIRFTELPFNPVTGSKESAGVHIILAEARALATEEEAPTADDTHLLRGILVLASDERCEAGASLRALFATLKIQPAAWAMALTVQHSWPSIDLTPGVYLSQHGV